MVRTNQGGSILSFIAIGAVLALLLAGGAYAVSQRGQQADVATTPPAEQADSQSSTADEKKPEAKGDTEAEKDQSETSPKPEQPVAEPKEAEKPAPQPSMPAPPAPDTSKPAPAPAMPATGAQPEVLPQTGPVEFIGSLIAAGALTSATIAYVHSRRFVAGL